VVVHSLTTPSGGSDLVATVGARHSRDGCGFKLAAGGPSHPRRLAGDPLSHGTWRSRLLRGAEEPTSPGGHAQAAGGAPLTVNSCIEFRL
jgi:hypothetical protein